VWASYARLTQIQASTIRRREFIDAAKIGGVRSRTIIRRHVAPNSFSPVLVKATMDVAFLIEWIAGLSFIGLGAQPPTPEWGAMIATSRNYVLTAWWYVLFPALGILVVVLGFNLLGSALDEHYFGRGGRGRLSMSALRKMRPEE
jgi:peptide/nickel transport system permease protein